MGIVKRLAVLGLLPQGEGVSYNFISLKQSQERTSTTMRQNYLFPIWVLLLLII